MYILNKDLQIDLMLLMSFFPLMRVLILINLLQLSLITPTQKIHGNINTSESIMEYDTNLKLALQKWNGKTDFNNTNAAPGMCFMAQEWISEMNSKPTPTYQAAKKDATAYLKKFKETIPIHGVKLIPFQEDLEPIQFKAWSIH